MMKNESFWSYNYVNNEFWNNDLCDTKEEAEAEGRIWAKEQDIDMFEVGMCEEVPIPTEIDIDYLFEKLDETYFDNTEMDGYDFSPYWESRTPENAEHIEALSAKITEALEEYVAAAKVTSHCYRVAKKFRVEV